MKFRAFLAAGVAAGAFAAIPATALAGPSGSGLLPTTTSTTPTPTTTTPAPVVTAAAAKANLVVGGLFDINKLDVTIPGRKVAVTGAVAPYRPGQRVTVEGIENGHVFARRTEILTPSAKKIDGHFSASFSAPAAGEVSIKVVHLRSTELLGFSVEKAYKVLGVDVGPGATGRLVDMVQLLLQREHVYIPQTGVYDNGTELALDTYHRLLGEGEGHTQIDAATVNDLLNGTGAFHIRYPNQGGADVMHAEGDLSEQVLAYIRGKSVVWLLPISSGKPSTPTILGEYQVYRKQPEYTTDGMYFSNFFISGYAIHGYDPAPDYPASHGCMRIPIVDAIFAYNLLNIGNWVDTYYT